MLRRWRLNATPSSRRGCERRKRKWEFTTMMVLRLAVIMIKRRLKQAMSRRKVDKAMI